MFTYKAWTWLIPYKWGYARYH